MAAPPSASMPPVNQGRAESPDPSAIAAIADAIGVARRGSVMSSVNSRARIARLVLIIGIPAIIFGLYALHASVVAVPTYDFISKAQFGWAALYAALLYLSAHALGLPDLAKNAQSGAWLGATAALLGAASISLVQFVLGSGLLPRFVVLGSAVLMVPLSAGAARIANGVGRLPKTRVLVVAAEADLAVFAADVRRDSERPAIVVASLTPVEAGERGEAMCERAAQVQATVVVLSAAALLDEAVVAQARALHAAGVRIRTVTQFYEQWLGKVPLSELEETSLLMDIGEVHEAYGRTKRVADVVGALALSVVLLIITPVVAVANLRGNKGPLFFTQQRVGRNGVPFRMVKFRTMVPHNGIGTWTAVDDPRVTPVGRLLRVTHLDELPQVINVLRGDLSLVGPRPEQPAYVAELTRAVPYYATRHLVRPGITGWAQVRYDYGASEQDAVEKLQFDFYYLRNQSLTLDVLCLVRTLRSVTRGAGR